jgi:pyrroline-5-carboxylate reductase
MIMKTNSVGFIGGGRITRIILESFERKDKWPKKVVVSDASEEALQKIAAQFPQVKIIHNGNIQAAAQDMVFLALHPPAIGSVLGDIKAHLKTNTILISLAPKASIANLSKGLGGFNRIVRMIPNAPTVVNKGYNPVAFSPSLGKEDKKGLIDLFKIFGDCPEVEEGKLEAYAILTAMGPTYFWFQINELQKLGASFGLTSKETDKALSKMMKGTTKTLFGSGYSFEEVIDLIPVRPISDEEASIRTIYRNKLDALYKKLKG